MNRLLVVFVFLLFDEKSFAHNLERTKRDIATDLGNVRDLLQGFLKMSDKVPLTPKRRSNFPSQPIRYRIVDRTEYAVNKKILNDVFESDMVLTRDQMLDVIENFKERINGTSHKRMRRKAIVGNNFQWANRTIPYDFRDHDYKWQNLIREGMKKWENETCLRFKRKDVERDYIEIFKGGGCYSSVGRIGGRQYTSIGWGCESAGIVAHELGHAIGFWHEQSRPDRDKYININEDHIYRGTKGNFEKRKDIEGLKEVPYDFGSIMHYGPQFVYLTGTPCTSPSRPKIIDSSTPSVNVKISLLLISNRPICFTVTVCLQLDIKFLDICKNTLQCKYGGYPDPHNCWKCKCPAGISGNLCEALPMSTVGCGGELFSNGIWQTLSNSVIGECYWRINAAPNQRIHFEVLEANFECDSSCAENYLEIKNTDDFQRTGFRQCCNAVPGPIISQQNQVLVFSKSVKPSNFTLRYIIDAENLPPPPLAAWQGGGFTSLLGGEAGFDNTFETYIIKELPKALKTNRPSNRPIDTLQTLISTFLRSTHTAK